MAASRDLRRSRFIGTYSKVMIVNGSWSWFNDLRLIVVQQTVIAVSSCPVLYVCMLCVCGYYSSNYSAEVKKQFSV